MVAANPGVVAIAVGHPVAEVVVPEQAARKLLGAQFGAGHRRDQLAHLHWRKIGFDIFAGDFQQFR